MNYINVLPKELQRELELHVNHVYWNALNRISKSIYNGRRGAIVSDMAYTKIKVEQYIKENIEPIYIKLNIAHVLNYEEIKTLSDNVLISKYYFQATNGQLITLKMLLEFINYIARFSYERTQIGILKSHVACVNKMFEDENIPQRLIKFATYNDQLKIIDKYCIIKINQY